MALLSSLVAKVVLGVGFPEGDADSANYYVMKVETDEKGNYEMALVGEPCRLFLWILSRKPVLDTDEDFQRYNNLLAFAEENDYNLDSWYLNFQPTEQASCGWETECTEVVDTRKLNASTSGRAVATAMSK